MLGIDTNVLVRFLVQDDPAQFARAEKLFRREASVFVSHLVLMETEWVLRSRYKLAKTEIHDAFSELLSAVELNVEEESSVEEALYVWKDSTAQFADCLIGAHNRARNCAATASFDSDTLKLPSFVAV